MYRMAHHSFTIVAIFVSIQDVNLTGGSSGKGDDVILPNRSFKGMDHGLLYLDIGVHVWIFQEILLKFI